MNPRLDKKKVNIVMFYGFLQRFLEMNDVSKSPWDEGIGHQGNIRLIGKSTFKDARKSMGVVK
jgi:hypothetical protein